MGVCPRAARAAFPAHICIWLILAALLGVTPSVGISSGDDVRHNAGSHASINAEASLGLEPHGVQELPLLRTTADSAAPHIPLLRTEAKAESPPALVSEGASSNTSLDWAGKTADETQTGIDPGLGAHLKPGDGHEDEGAHVHDEQHEHTKHGDHGVYHEHEMHSANIVNDENHEHVQADHRNCTSEECEKQAEEVGAAAVTDKADCQAEYNDAISNNQLAEFCHRCLHGEGNQSTGHRCALICAECEVQVGDNATHEETAVEAEAKAEVEEEIQELGDAIAVAEKKAGIDPVHDTAIVPESTTTPEALDDEVEDWVDRLMVVGGVVAVVLVVVYTYRNIGAHKSVPDEACIVGGGGDLQVKEETDLSPGDGTKRSQTDVPAAADDPGTSPGKPA